ncbi:centrin-1-like [Benincasa hispida]|uniref:centrin-1-like n=1 Tax=Benincasa hispida TaxID=102211 RepID=UPI0019029FF0|nr:centrin-1-like [Benincasa hispida]
MKKPRPRGSKNGRNVKDVPEYEKQRLSRISENKKRIEALGLAKLATSLLDSSKNLSNIDRKGKRKLGDADDEDYKPSEDSSSSEDDDSDSEEEEEYFGSGKVYGSRGMKGKNRGSEAKRKVPVKKSNNSDDEDDDEDALRQAIKLSLQDSGENCDAQVQGPLENVRRKNVKNQEVRGGMKRKGLFTSRMQMNDDELIMNFYCFDDSWKGDITVSDLKRVAAAHDFTWSDIELRDMIDCFDSDGDGKLNLNDFRRIAGRCNMIKESIT